MFWCVRKRERERRKEKEKEERERNRKANKPMKHIAYSFIHTNTYKNQTYMHTNT